MRTRVKICCIMSTEEAALAVREGADAIGLVGAMPSGPGVVDRSTIRAIARTVPPAVATFLLSSATGAEGLADDARDAGAGVLQIVDAPEPGALAAVRLLVPALKLVQVIHVAGEAAIAEARGAAAEADAILLDSGRPGALVRELGGTGRVHDWEISRAVVEAVTVPVFLAGGLDPANVVRAIRMVRPFGVDLCSGVRTGGRLDEAKLAAFMGAVRTA
ncbi:MAG TPA: phosphoribosylanthranilate isomerase [Geminicoccaceae bacterium]|nr:phosphoribosylanthranilate isomerase [Geminicoccaceae bacterium]